MKKGLIVALVLLTCMLLPAQSIFNIYGDWGQHANNATVQIEIEFDEMEIEIKDYSTGVETTYKGYPRLGDSTIIFTAYQVKTENMFGWEMERKRRVNETFNLAFTFNEDNSITFSGSQVPAINGTYRRIWD